MIRGSKGITPVLLVSCALGVPLPAGAQSLATETFAESLRALTRSSGEVFRGIHQGTLDVRPNIAALSVTLPPGRQSRLCLTLETQDARYFGQASYRIGVRASPTRHTLSLPTAHRGLLESLPIRDISAIGFVAESCEAGARVFLPVSLGAPRAPDGSLALLINSRTPGVSVRIFHDQTRQYAECANDSITERQVAFNVECRIALPSGPHTLTIVRNRAEKVLEPETIAAYIP